MSDLRPVLIGEAPSRTSDPARPFSGKSGGFLAGLCSFESYEELDAAFELVNLFSRWPGREGKGSKWPVKLATDRADYVQASGLLRGRRVVFVGRRVAAAFYASSRSWKYLSWVGGDFYVAVFPHPSRVNLRWNRAENVNEARDFLRALLKEVPDARPERARPSTRRS